MNKTRTYGLRGRGGTVLDDPGPVSASVDVCDFIGALSLGTSFIYSSAGKRPVTYVCSMIGCYC